mmetsp:Transcript_20636/g.46692  ORF Transcript_20636/g.46692 Transcript_20636/m.46692 type:complete len:278 (+) Transcript_20636:693-1526(+)
MHLLPALLMGILEARAKREIHRVSRGRDYRCPPQGHHHQQAPRPPRPRPRRPHLPLPPPPRRLCGAAGGRIHSHRRCAAVPHSHLQQAPPRSNRKSCPHARRGRSVRALPAQVALLGATDSHPRTPLPSPPLLPRQHMPQAELPRYERPALGISRCPRLWTGSRVVTDAEQGRGGRDMERDILSPPQEEATQKVSCQTTFPHPLPSQSSCTLASTASSSPALLRSSLPPAVDEPPAVEQRQSLLLFPRHRPPQPFQAPPLAHPRPPPGLPCPRWREE